MSNRRINGRTRKNELGNVSPEKSPEESSKDINKVVKMENEDNTCRVCLKEGSIPIFGNSVSEDISESLITFSGIDVKIDDPYPKYLCATCNSLLQGAIIFRKTAQESDGILKKPLTEDLPSDGVDTSPGNQDTDDFSNDNADAIHCSDDDVPPPNYKRLKVFRCKKCNITFNTFKELNDHRMSDEHENMRHVCPYCNKTYAPLYFKKHLALHTNGTSYVCDVCGKKFVMQGHFTRHRLTHFYKLPFKCSQCPYKGRFRESLKMHMRTHTGERPYQCTQCPSRFINKSNLNKHMLTHKKDPDFKCDTCGRGFYTKREVDLHYKADHAGVKEHVCKVCGKAFGYRKQMMKHELKVHKRAKLRSGRTPIYLKVESMQQQGQNVVES